MQLAVTWLIDQWKVVRGIGHQRCAKWPVARPMEGNANAWRLELLLCCYPTYKSHFSARSFKLFQFLCGECMLSDAHHLIPAISSEHLAHVNMNRDWSLAFHWVQWWTRPSHLKMLNKCIFSDMPAKNGRDAQLLLILLKGRTKIPKDLCELTWRKHSWESLPHW